MKHFIFNAMKKVNLNQLSRWFWKICLLFGIAAVIIFEVRALFFPGASTVPSNNQSLKVYAQEVYTKCSTAQYRPACYDEEIPKLMDTITMEQAFDVTRLIQDRDPSYAYCHVLGHKLSSREVQKDMSKWTQIIARCPVGLCANGCLHGAFQERFRAEALTDEQILGIQNDLEMACEQRSDWHPTGLEQATCYHGLGHVSMQMTEANTQKAIQLCDRISLKNDGRDYRQLCYEGLFMQLFQPLEPEDFALIKGKIPVKKDLVSYCNSFGSSSIEQACFGEGWPLFRTEIETPIGLSVYCGKPSTQAGKDRCFYMMFHVVGQNNNFDHNKIKDFCSSKDLSDGRRGECFADAASSVIQADKRYVGRVVDLCAAAAQVGVGEACYKGLAEFATYDLSPNSPELTQLCQSLPQEYQQKCFHKN